VQVLLVKPVRNRDSWGVPKGHLDAGESLEECAVREVNEEAGISVRLEERLIDVVTSSSTTDKTVVTWLAQQTCSTTPFPADGENVEVKWFSIAGLPKLHSYQNALLKDASERLLRRKDAR
jgi:8-oxo-dGTP diphosphatase